MYYAQGAAVQRRLPLYAYVSSVTTILGGISRVQQILLMVPSHRQHMM